MSWNSSFSSSGHCADSLKTKRPFSLIRAICPPFLSASVRSATSFKKGIDGILVMSCGSECPFEKAFPQLSARVGQVGRKLKQWGIENQRIKLTAICTVCAKHVVKEITEMNEYLLKVGPIQKDKIEI